MDTSKTMRPQSAREHGESQASPRHEPSSPRPASPPVDFVSLRQQTRQTSARQRQLTSAPAQPSAWRAMEFTARPGTAPEQRARGFLDAAFASASAEDASALPRQLAWQSPDTAQSGGDAGCRRSAGGRRPAAQRRGPGLVLLAGGGSLSPAAASRCKLTQAVPVFLVATGGHRRTPTRRGQLASAAFFTTSPRHGHVHVHVHVSGGAGGLHHCMYMHTC